MRTPKFNKWEVVYTYYDLKPHTIEAFYEWLHPQTKTMDFYYATSDHDIIHEDVFITFEEAKEKHNEPILEKIKKLEYEINQYKSSLL